MVRLILCDIEVMKSNSKISLFYLAVRHVLSAEGQSKYTTSKVRLDKLRDSSPRGLYNEIISFASAEMQTMIEYCEPPSKKRALNFLVFSVLRSITDFENVRDIDNHQRLFFDNYLKVAVAHEIDATKTECYKAQLTTFSAVEHADMMTEVVAYLMEDIAQTPAT